MDWKKAEISEDGKYYLIPRIDFDKETTNLYDINDFPVNPYRLRMFDFRYDGYGESFTVLARSKQQALDYLLDFFKSKDQDKVFYDDEYNKWTGVIVEDPNTYPRGYSIIEYEEGGVLETEAA